MAATGASLELRKLQAYPIPVSQLFGIEVILRITAAIEVVLVLNGMAMSSCSIRNCPGGVPWRPCRISCSTCSSPRA